MRNRQDILAAATPTVAELMARKSVRVFTDRPIAEEITEEILTAAAEAPTAGCQQLYTILNITDPSLKEALADSCDHQPFIATAPLVLVFCTDCRKWYEAFRLSGAAPRDPGAGDFFLALSDTAIAAQNAVTAAWSRGIGSCYIGDILENFEIQRDLLHLPRYVIPTVMAVFGYPTEQQKSRPKPPRIPLSYLVAENEYPTFEDDDYRAMFASRTGELDYETWIKRFCERKYNSDFSREMTRSAEEILRSFR